MFASRCYLDGISRNHESGKGRDEGREKEKTLAPSETKIVDLHDDECRLVGDLNEEGGLPCLVINSMWDFATCSLGQRARVRIQN